MLHMFHKRQGQMEIAYCYFYTDTICEFKKLLTDDNLKMKIIESWQYLTEKKLIKIYGYVIMPNHIHLLWQILDQNGKESPAGSFAKYTAHQFKKYLQANNEPLLHQFKSDKSDRLFQFWKRDPLAIPIDKEEILLQKLDYIHWNPVREKWNLAKLPEEYRWSSARFYETGYDEFGIITHFKED
ncbi:MAG TPA: transposase [Chitinophagales bacterium]|nr:transposase [Chitinophagales bacterium]